MGSVLPSMARGQWGFEFLDVVKQSSIPCFWIECWTKFCHLGWFLEGHVGCNQGAGVNGIRTHSLIPTVGHITP